MERKYDSKYSKKHQREENQDIKISKQMSSILRHNAEKYGVNMDSDGFVKLEDLMSLHQFKGVSLEKIYDIVENNDKKRFQITKKDDEKGNRVEYIRATQGHTITGLNDEELMKEKITDASKFPLIVHGTFNKFWPLIKESGLKKMGRNHVHFAIGYPGEQHVISGMRKVSEVFIEINLKKALEDGLVFYLSHNDVVLSAGIDGVIPTKYFSKVYDKSGKELPFDAETEKK